jgi:hypothetical protein
MKERSVMDEETRDHKQRLLNIYQGNLEELQIQSARFGSNPPLIIINEIKEHRRNIDELRIQLELNAQEVSIDKIIVGIEDIQRLSHKEARRALKEYTYVFRTQVGLGLGVVGLISGGLHFTNWIIKSIRPRPMNAPIDIVDIALYIIGGIFSVSFGLWFGFTMSESKRRHFNFRMGYDPFKDNE